MAAPKLTLSDVRERLGEVGHLIAVADAVMLGASQLTALAESKRMVDSLRLLVIEAGRAVRDARAAHEALLKTIVDKE